MAPVSAADQSGTTWMYWSNIAMTANTSSTEPWGIWCNTAGTTSASVAQTIWLDWTGASGPVIANAYGYRQPTPEEVEARRREEAERRRVAQEAKAKARQLLREVLDRDQRRELERDGHFHVSTRNGERVYRLKPGAQPERVKGEDGTRWSYCIHPREWFPAEDTVAALKLLIEADEDEFLRIANASSRGRLAVA